MIKNIKKIQMCVHILYTALMSKGQSGELIFSNTIYTCTHREIWTQRGTADREDLNTRIDTHGTLAHTPAVLSTSNFNNMDAPNTTTQTTNFASDNLGSSTTTTSLSSSNPNEDQDDDGRDRKEKTASTATSNGKSAATLPRPPPRFEEDCPVCLEPLQSDVSTFSRLVCCGQGLHKHCSDGIRKSTMSYKQKNSCVMCRARYPATPKEAVKMTRIWVDKGKAWAQSHLAHQCKQF